MALIACPGATHIIEGAGSSDGQYSPLPSAQQHLTRRLLADAPVCDETQDLVYGVSENETVSVSCSVNSFPPADTFTWSFNNSLTSSLLPPASYLSSPGHSLISYTPHSHMDFGTLLCWGTNMVGNQRTNQPCVFHIIPTGQHIQIE